MGSTGRGVTSALYHKLHVLLILPLYFLAEGMRVSLVSISSSSEILSTVVRYSITLVSRSGRREISKMCSMYDRLSAWEVLLIGLIAENASRLLLDTTCKAVWLSEGTNLMPHLGPACRSSPGSWTTPWRRWCCCSGPLGCPPCRPTWAVPSLHWWCFLTGRWAESCTPPWSVQRQREEEQVNKPNKITQRVKRSSEQGNRN